MQSLTPVHTVGHLALTPLIRTPEGDLIILSSRHIQWLAFASAIVTANAYYIQPIIGRVADSFGVSHGQVGVVPAMNQIALALGVLLLLPLGDRVRNDRLVAVCLSAQVIALITMAMTRDFSLFVIASTLLGFFTLTPYLLPAWASKRVEPAQLGHATAVLTAGVIAGVQVSRLGSGVIAEWLDWRTVYWLAAGLMALSALALPKIMNRVQGEPEARSQGPTYPTLLKSLAGLARTHRSVMMSGLIQGFNFGIFIATGLGISLHLTSASLGYGTDLVGYLTAFAAIGLVTTPRLGRWADGFGPQRARLVMALIQFVGVTTLLLANDHWLPLILPLTVMSIVGPMVDVTGRMTSLRNDPAVRTRLMSLYITLMFLGGGLGSWCGTLAYDLGGWSGTVGLVILMSSVVCLLSFLQRGQKISATTG